MIAKIIIPTHDNDGRSLESEIESTIKSMCSEFGGATVFDARGCWVNNDGKLYENLLDTSEQMQVLLEELKLFVAKAKDKGLPIKLK